jgi:hypothetical protein
MSLWTVDTLDKKTTSGHFGDLRFEKPGEPGRGWKATIQNFLRSAVKDEMDWNSFEFEFRFRGAALIEFWEFREVTLKDGTKSYTKTHYTRP